MTEPFMQRRNYPLGARRAAVPPATAHAKRVLRSLALCVLVAGAAVAMAAPPASAYGGLPDISGVRMSPDGKRLLMLRPVDGALQPFVVALADGDGVQPVAIRHGRLVLRECEWAWDDRIVCSFLKYYELSRDSREPKGGYPSRGMRVLRLVAFDPDGGNPLELVPPATEPSQFPTNEDFTEFESYLDINPKNEWEHRVVSYLPHDPDHILVTLPREVMFTFTVYRLNIRTNELTAVTRPEHMITPFWSADDNGRVRIGVGTSWSSETFGERRFMVEDGEGGFRFQDAPRLGSTWFPPRVLGYTKDGESAFVEGIDAETGRIVAWKVESATLEVERVVVAYPDRDATLTPIKGVECGVKGFSDDALGTLTWLDASFGREVEALEARLPGRIRAVPSMSADCSRLVVLTDGGGLSPTYYVHDRRSGGTRRIGSRRPELDGRLGATRQVTYAARDGQEIDARMTLPRNAAPGPLPMVVVPSGAAVHNNYGFDGLTEFLASRGYAVLAPNGRGTPGSGDAHWKAGFAMWGTRMRTDMADGVAWAVAEGVAAADRVCYAGRGLGGYMALVGATGDGSRARCAAAFAFDEPRNTMLVDRVHRHDWLWRFWLDHPRRYWHTGTIEPFTEQPPVGESAARSPLLAPAHPGFPVLIDGGRRMPAPFRKNSRKFRRSVQAAGGVERMLPLGSRREVEFLTALETLLDQTIGDPEMAVAGSRRVRRSD